MKKEKQSFIEKVKEGLKDAKEGKTVPLKKVRERFERKWKSKL